MNGVTKWLEIGQSLAPRVLQSVHAALSESKLSDLTLANVPKLALYHLNASLNASIESNIAHQPAVSLALLRQCVESLTVIEAGLQQPKRSELLLRQWRDGQLTTGGLRKQLESIAWPAYGSGLWNETWAEFFANLAKSVHPYAHYSPELQQWQIAVVEHDGPSKMFVVTDGQTCDPLKASRITLLQILVVWTLARVVAATHPKHLSSNDTALTNELGKALASSKLLFHAADWSAQLLPHVLFPRGVSWMDP